MTAVSENTTLLRLKMSYLLEFVFDSRGQLQAVCVLASEAMERETAFVRAKNSGERLSIFLS